MVLVFELILLTSLLLPPPPKYGKISSEKGGEIMKWPDFQDFLSTLSQEKTEKIVLDAKLKCEALSNSGAGEQISAISWTISLELLALYHLWLEGSLPDD